MKRKICGWLAVLLLCFLAPPPATTAGTAEGMSPVTKEAEETGPEAEETGGEAEDSEREAEPDGASDPVEENPQNAEQTPHARFSSYALAPSEAVVSSFAELKAALADNADVVTVYLAADIQLITGGIVVAPHKTSVVIDGVSPLDETGRRHTLSDVGTATYTDCIRVGETSATKSVTLRNLVLVGRNYYGTVSVPDAARNVVVSYENVDYTGPQITHNAYGTTRYTDTNIVIDDGNGGSPRQEVAETRYVEFRGAVNIQHNSTANWVFWFRTGEGSITVCDGADVRTTVTKSVVSFLAGSAARFSVEANASFSYTAPGHLNDALFTQLSVAENGRFFIENTSSSALPVLNVTGDITVGEGAAFEITANTSAASAIMRLGGELLVQKDAVFHVLSSGGFTMAVRIAGLNKSVRFEDPASVILYNKNGTIAFPDGPGTLSVEAQQINYWNTLAALPGAGGFGDPPRYGWYKADGSLFTISGKLSASGSFTALTSNYELGDLPGVAPSGTNFHIGQSKALSFGRLEIVAAPFYDDSVQVDGVTAPGAAIRIGYPQESEWKTIYGQAGDDGGFGVATGGPVAIDTLIEVESNRYFLTARTVVTVEKRPDLGLLEFLSVPRTLPFETTALSSRVQLVARLYPQWHIAVSDTRNAGGGWKLYARVLREPTPAGDMGIPVLRDSLVFVDDDGRKTPMGLAEDTLVHRNATTDDGTTVIMWPPNRGVLVEIRPGEAYADTPYHATILWTLTDAP